MANIKENKKYHFTYRTTNLINGRYYLGMHSTNRLDDGYLGSGKRLYYEVNKYGRDNFKFEILKQFNSREELVQAEVNLITEEDISNSNCLNLKPGGQGGFSKDVQMLGSTMGNIKKRELLQTDQKFKEEYSRVRSIAMKKQYKNGKENPNKGHWKGRKHSEESKKKIGSTNSNKQKGRNNSQYGTCWITDEYSNKKIYKGDLIPDGWRLGRKLK